jgi:adenylate cyclase
MAFWNAPLDVPNHPELACRAALAIQESVQRLNETWAAAPPDDGKPPPKVSVGVGLNTGLCLVGNLGSDFRLSYSVLGDPVNLSSRVEGQTKNYGVPILITETTQKQAPMMAALEVDRIAVKGKVEAVTIFALLGDESVAASDAFKSLQTAQAALLAAYRAQRWDEALAGADALARANPTLAGLAKLYRDHIVELRANPPVTAPGEAWDGVYIAVDK